jgi:hypothetical protein
MRTDEIIERLARDVRPLKPLRHPLRRGMEWLAGTSLFLAGLVAIRAMMLDAPLAGIPMTLAVAQSAAMAASVTAAAAAFVTIVPGASRRVLPWPFLATAVWIGSLLLGLLREGGGGIAVVSAATEWPCVLLIALGSLVPVVGLIHLLRQGAPLVPRSTLALGVLAAAGAANVAACLSHPHTSSRVLLFWHGATILVLVAAGALAGRNILAWPRPQLR